MTETNAMAIFDQGSKLLAEATTIQQNKKLKTLGITAAEWARRKGMGDEAVSLARAFAFDAERQMGRLLEKSKRRTRAHETGGGSKGSRRAPLLGAPLTLEELGITKKESSAAQKLASLPKRVYKQVRDGLASRTEAFRNLRRDQVQREVAAMPEGKYRVFYADPPWKYGDQLTENYGGTKFHYPSMTITDLCAMPIKDLAFDDAVLFIWVTSPILPECFAVIEAWGFKYKASFVWDKVRHNMGHYNSVRHEFLLICTRGSCLPDSNKLTDSVQSIERTTKHSQKPERFREIIDEMYSTGRRLELFARMEIEGWSHWGNEPTA